MEPASFGRMAQRSRLFWVTASARSVSSAPGSKSGRNTAPGCAASRVVELFPLAEIFSRNWAESGAATTFTASPFTVALNSTCLSWLAARDSRSSKARSPGPAMVDLHQRSRVVASGVAVNWKLAVPTAWPFCAISKLPDCACAAGGKTIAIKAKNPASGRKREILHEVLKSPLPIRLKSKRTGAADL